MVKFREASPGAAYEIAEGVTNAEEAAALGLAVVEVTPEGRPSAYGRYKDAPEGGPLGITTFSPDNVTVKPGGHTATDSAAATAGKGSLVNIDDPFVHGTGGESVHKDGANPQAVDRAADERELAEAARKNNEAHAKSVAKK
jgi:hypothetical protein